MRTTMRGFSASRPENFAIATSEWSERAGGRLEFGAQQPIVVEAFEFEPLFEGFAAGGFEFDQHFAVVQAHQHTQRVDVRGAMGTRRTIFPRLGGCGAQWCETKCSEASALLFR